MIDKCALTESLTVCSFVFVEFISPAVMVPENRLETMLKQAVDHQIKNCFYHDNRNTSKSLYSDHVCDKYVRFSYISNACFCYLPQYACWQCSQLIHVRIKYRTGIPTVTRQVLERHTNEVWYISFSHDGKYLASASADSKIIIWNLEVKSVRNVGHFTLWSLFLTRLSY